jgi:hypothetical protein
MEKFYLSACFYGIDIDRIKNSTINSKEKVTLVCAINDKHDDTVMSI